MLVSKCVSCEQQAKFNVSKYDVVINPLAGPVADPLAGSLTVSLVGPLADPLAVPLAVPLVGPVAGSLVGPLAGSLVGPLAGSLVGPVAGVVAAKWEGKWYLGKWYWKGKHSALLELVYTRLYSFCMRLHTGVYVRSVASNEAEEAVASSFYQVRLCTHIGDVLKITSTCAK